MSEEGRVPWKESNLALIGSDLDHKVKAAAAELEEQWQGIGETAETRIWRIEKFVVVPWPEEKFGSFHKGDSYVVLNSYTVDDSDALRHDIHIWIGSESSQDEYGTAAYKMVEADESLGGAAIQHRQIQGHEAPMFKQYFGKPLKYLEGGIESGFTHVEPTPDDPHLYRVRRGDDNTMSLTQMARKKSSLNKGDSFIVFANPESVWVWHGESASPHEKMKATSLAEEMCMEGTVTVLDQGSGDEEDEAFWGYLEDDGDIADVEEAEEGIEEFCPLLFRLCDDPDEEPEQVAKAEEPITEKFGKPNDGKLDRGLLNDSDVYLLDAGWEVFLWIGKDADRSEKLMSMIKADRYCSQDPRTSDIPLTIVKSECEGADFAQYFTE